MDEIGEGFVRVIWNIIRWVFWEVFFEVALFNIGQGFLLIITWGKYPKGRYLEAHSGRISMVGLLVLILLCSFIL